MRKLIMIIFFILCSVLIFLSLQSKWSVTTIKYFPIDDTESFSNTTTALLFDETSSTLKWQTTSETENKMYLRQDIGLLFKNGYFKGIHTKWEQNSSKIQMVQNFPVTHSGLFEAISFHHGEIHHEQDIITSIQKMSVAQTYIDVKEKGKSQNISANHMMNEASLNQFKNRRNKLLEDKWQEIMEHFQVNIDDYHLVALTDLIQYEQINLPERSEEKTKQILGQLWEGLYKNYVLLLKEKENKTYPHYMPIILFSKDQSHLIVLFELHDGKKKLIQQLN